MFIPAVYIQTLTVQILLFTLATFVLVKFVSDFDVIVQCIFTSISLVALIALEWFDMNTKFMTSCFPRSLKYLAAIAALQPRLTGGHMLIIVAFPGESLVTGCAGEVHATAVHVCVPLKTSWGCKSSLTNIA